MLARYAMTRYLFVTSRRSIETEELMEPVLAQKTFFEAGHLTLCFKEIRVSLI